MNITIKSQLENLRAENTELVRLAREWRYAYVAAINPKHTHSFFMDGRCFLCGKTREKVRQSMPSPRSLKAKRARKQRRAGVTKPSRGGK